MPNIVAGRFEDTEQADRAARALADAGFGPQSVELFHINPPGQHHGLPLGGDKVADETADGGEKGTATGAAIGTAAGAALGVLATPLAGPVAIAAGAATGAFIGSLGGTMNRLTQEADAKGSPPERPAGLMLAVHAPDAAAQERALTTLARNGGRELEIADGQWIDGHWADFDPIAPPRYAEVDQYHAGPTAR